MNETDNSVKEIPKEILPPRQDQILRLILDGKRPKEIAKILEISRRTVEGHLHSRSNPVGLYHRWNVHSRSELAIEAFKRGYDTSRNL